LLILFLARKDGLTVAPLHQSKSGDPLVAQELILQLIHGVQACVRCRMSKLAASKDEERAFQQFYDLYNPLLKRFAAACGMKGEEAKDCLQDTWTRIIKGLHQFHDEDATHGRLCSWMNTIVRNLAADLRRYRTRHSNNPLGRMPKPTSFARNGGPVAACDQLCREEMVRQLLELLRAEVPELAYLIFYKHWIEQKTVKEIASEMNLAPHRVSCRLFNALEKLRERAKEKFPELFERLNSMWGGGVDLRIHP
jgi:RNA polymerase sigma factor (sigma-70 family)